MSIRILVLDDDPSLRDAHRLVFERRGHVVEMAADGEEGLRKIADFQPDVVVTDIVMPGMDGWEFVRALRSHAEFALLPVIFLTSLNSREGQLRGFKLGADAYITKPFDFEVLEARVVAAAAKARSVADAARRQLRDDDDGPAGLRGELAELGAGAVLSLLELERKSGWLELAGQRRARLVLDGGRVVAAAVIGADRPALVGLDAVAEVLAWESGEFEFVPREVDVEDEFGMSTTQVLMEAAERLDERARP